MLIYYSLHVPSQAVYCVASQALPLISSLCCLLLPMCFLSGTTITLHTLLCAHCLVSPVCFLSGTTTNLQSVLLTMPLCFLPGTTITLHTVVCAHCPLSPVCFLSGTTITLQSVLFTMPCVLPLRHYHYYPVCAVYYALCTSSQALPLHCTL